MVARRFLPSLSMYPVPNVTTGLRTSLPVASAAFLAPMSQFTETTRS